MDAKEYIKKNNDLKELLSVAKRQMREQILYIKIMMKDI